jgi:hypothetical protein
MMYRRVLVLLVLAVGSQSLAAQAEPSKSREIVLLVGADMQHSTDRALDYFKDNDWVSQVRLGVEVEILEDWFVGPSYAYGSSESRLFDRYDTRWSQHQLQLAVRKGFQVFSWLRPYAVLSGTYSITETRAEGATTLAHDEGFLDGAWGAKGGLGVELMIPRRFLRPSSTGKGLFKDFSAGVAWETGYSIQQSHDMERMTFQPGTRDVGGTVAAGTVDFGDLNLSGWYQSIHFRLYF